MFTQSAQYYDAIYLARGKDYEKEVRLLYSIIEQHKQTAGNALLDVACGTGGHLAFLRDAFEVQGLDIDKSMLKIAREKLPGTPLHEADMVEFNLKRKFDVVISLFSSIGFTRTKERLEAAIDTMAKHVYPGGLVIVEPWIYPEDFTPGRAHAVFVEKPDLKITRMNVNTVEDGVAILHFHYLVATGGEVHNFEEKHEIALFTLNEYMLAFKAAGLEVVHDKKGLDGRGLYIGLKSAGVDG